MIAFKGRIFSLLWQESIPEMAAVPHKFSECGVR